MTFAVGGSLARKLCVSPARKLPVHEVARLLRDILQAFDYIHAKGVLHLDVTPSNILHDGTCYLLADFGLSHFSATTDARPWGGTRSYVAPEMLARSAKVSAKADIWSFGAVLYEALTGLRLGATAGDAAVLGAALVFPELTADVPPAVSTLLRLMLTVNPAERPDSSALLQHPVMAEVIRLADSAARSPSAHSLGSALASAPVPDRFPTSAVNVARAPAVCPVPDCYSAPAFLALPPRPEIIGREVELSALREMCPAEEGSIVATIHGSGGIGKTAIALVVAHEWISRYPDGQLFLDARGTQPSPTTPEALLGQVIHAIHPNIRLPEHLDALRALFISALRGRRMLIILDSAHDTDQARHLAPPPGCALIITSRKNEALEGCAPLLVSNLPTDDSVSLLRRSVSLSDADAAAIAGQCGGSPLALRLAGCALALGGVPRVADYLTRLRRDPASVRLCAATDSSCYSDRSLEALPTITDFLRVTEELLAFDDRKTWYKLGVFTSSFDTDAAVSVVGAQKALLQQLTRLCLLELESAERYRLNELVATYARAQLDTDTTVSVHLAHAYHFTRVGADANQRYLHGDTSGAVALFDCNRNHIESARDWLHSHLDASDAKLSRSAARQLVSMVDGVVHISEWRFHPRHRLLWYGSHVKASAILQDKVAACRALGYIGQAFFALGEVNKAITQYNLSLALCREIGDRRCEGLRLSSLGQSYAALGDMSTAVSMALAINRTVHDLQGEGANLSNLGRAFSVLGNEHKAIELYKQALEISRTIGDRRCEGVRLSSLGQSYAKVGKSEEAIKYYEQALAISRELGDRRGEKLRMTNLGYILARLGRAREAIDHYEHALKISREVGDRRGEGDILAVLGQAFYAVGEALKAITAYQQAIDSKREVGDQRGEILLTRHITHVREDPDAASGGSSTSLRSLSHEAPVGENICRQRKTLQPEAAAADEALRVVEAAAAEGAHRMAEAPAAEDSRRVAEAEAAEAALAAAEDSRRVAEAAAAEAAAADNARRRAEAAAEKEARRRTEAAAEEEARRQSESSQVGCFQCQCVVS